MNYILYVYIYHNRWQRNRSLILSIMVIGDGPWAQLEGMNETKMVPRWLYCVLHTYHGEGPMGSIGRWSLDGSILLCVTYIHMHTVVTYINIVQY